jgi:NADP-dependent aldehyde dehydrogenase
MAINKDHLVAGIWRETASNQSFQAFEVRTGDAMPPIFHEADRRIIDDAVSTSLTAFKMTRTFTPGKLSQGLLSIAKALQKWSEEIIARCHRETALPIDRLQKEMSRTILQIHALSEHIQNKPWLNAVIQTAVPDSSPAKSDLRRCSQPLGPVAVFGASNFPLAFSIAGGDTMSALATGNTVIVKANPAHPGTSALTAAAVQEGLSRIGYPDGTFSMIQGSLPETSDILVTHPALEAVAFTGSNFVGRRLHDLVAQRPRPIPIFCEMGSLNPVILFPEKLRREAPALAKLLADAITVGNGQFCTKPGLILAVDGRELDRFLFLLKDELSTQPCGPMVTREIGIRYCEAIHARCDRSDLIPHTICDLSVTAPTPQLFETSASEFMQRPDLQEEFFGPVSLLVRCQSDEEMRQLLDSLPGQLTITFHADKKEIASVHPLLRSAGRKAGRILWGGVPTGVEVSPAMVHGGPYPASTDSRFTSVGTSAVERFLRPVCYQNFPDELLPAALQNENPLVIQRWVNGVFTRDPLG